MAINTLTKYAKMVNCKCMDLIDLRKQHGLTQKEAAQLIGVPYRTYIRYEENPSYVGSFKYRMFLSTLENALRVDEEHGLLTIDKIKELLMPIFKQRNISFCYLFGSYAKGTAKEKSDVDLLVDTDITGFEFFGFVEEIRTALHKRVDLLRLGDLKADNPIILEILKDGIRII